MIAKVHKPVPVEQRGRVVVERVAVRQRGARFGHLQDVVYREVKGLGVGKLFAVRLEHLLQHVACAVHGVAVDVLGHEACVGLKGLPLFDVRAQAPDGGSYDDDEI